MRIAPYLGRFSLRTIRILFSRLVPSGCKVKCVEFWRIWGVTKRPASEISHSVKTRKRNRLALVSRIRATAPSHTSRNFSFQGRDFPRLPLPGFFPVFSFSLCFSLCFAAGRSEMEERNCVYRPGNGRGVHARSKATTTTSEPMSPKFIGNSISVV